MALREDELDITQYRCQGTYVVCNWCNGFGKLLKLWHEEKYGYKESSEPCEELRIHLRMY